MKEISKSLATDDKERCIACDQELADGDLVLDDIAGGVIHAACCGPERDSYVRNLNSGAPLRAGDPLPKPWRWAKP